LRPRPRWLQPAARSACLQQTRQSQAEHSQPADLEQLTPGRMAPECLPRLIHRVRLINESVGHSGNAAFLSFILLAGLRKRKSPDWFSFQHARLMLRSVRATCFRSIQALRSTRKEVATELREGYDQRQVNAEVS